MATKTLWATRYLSLLQNEEEEVFVRSSDGVMIVPLTAGGEVILINEPSPAFAEPALLLPSGEIEPGESALETASRELMEEIGFKPGYLKLLGELRPWAKYVQMRMWVYLGADLRVGTLQGDEKHVITTERIRLLNFDELIADGRLRDSSVIAALYMARSVLTKEKL